MKTHPARCDIIAVGIRRSSAEPSGGFPFSGDDATSRHAGVLFLLILAPRSLSFFPLVSGAPPGEGWK